MRLHRIFGSLFIGLSVFAATASPAHALGTTTSSTTTPPTTSAPATADALLDAATESAAMPDLGAATSASDLGNAEHSTDITSASLRFDTRLITMDIELESLNINTNSWLAAQFSFNGSENVDGMVVYGQLEEGGAPTVGAANRWGSPCSVHGPAIDGNKVKFQVDSVCMGRPGSVAYSVVYGDFYASANDASAVSYEPTHGFSEPVTKPGGYWLLGKDGGVFTFGDAPFYGSTGNLKLNSPVVGMSALSDASGYRFAASDGGVFSYGDAKFRGSMGGKALNQPIVGMSTTPSGKGYWLVAADGGIFSFGDAKFYGSTGHISLNKPIVGMQPSPSGKGYWLVATDGGIFAFGDAKFYGSTGSINLNMPIKSMAPSPDGRGYYLMAEDGGVFTFGPTAPFRGSAVGRTLAANSAMSAKAGGYLMVDQIGGVYEMGDVYHFGDLVDMGVYPNAAIIDLETTAG
jgi:hypothetical protein